MLPKKGKLLILLLSLILPAGVVYAGEAPLLVSPENNSTTTTSRIEWTQPTYPLYSSNPYKVQVDNNSDFSSPEKDEYKTNTSYTPVLGEGNWYWRVRAKDSSGVWSNWSNSWSFNLVATPTPIPTSIQSGPTSSPTPTPAATSTATSGSTFQVSQIPSKINSDQSFSVSISISGLAASTKYYLKGAFFKSGSTNYFGKTKVGGEWIKNSSTYTSQYSYTTDSSGSFNQSLEIMPDDSDSGFSDSGNYLFKVGRYNSTGSGPTWSNEVEIAINKVSTSTNAAAITSSSPEPISPANQKITTVATSNKENDIKYQIPEIKGVATDEARVESENNPNIKSANQINWFFIVGGILVLGTGGFFVFKNSILMLLKRIGLVKI